RVVLTRDGDVFVPLEMRVSIARQAGADVFISLHADALVAGRASGATIYTLSEQASDLASQKLAERHNRADLLAGIDLSSQDDVIVGVLMDMARTETAHRSDRLADALVDGLTQTVTTHKRPRLSAGFSVLKAPDIPSVLVELGFLSSPRDRKNLSDPKWRLRAATGIKNALINWAREDAAQALLLRK
ncbi:MAG: N-acetylmuramoyl-L-alanine amidase, partial [Marinosulfonomonas sp.]|nr:N-acetylmuramoyl-L-alanine amidase [Marinosulfonomonas sp.]